MVSGEQKVLAIIAHTAYLFGGIGLIFAPLVIFLIKRNDHFIYNHAKQALVAQLLLFIFSSIVSLLTFLFIGILLWPLLGLMFLGLFIISIIASFKALNGDYYEYPLIQGIVDMI